MNLHRRVICVTVLCSSQIACTTIKAYDGSSSIPELRKTYRSGDEITIVLATGRTVELKLIAVGKDWLEGNSETSATTERYQDQDIQSIRRREFDTFKTIALIASIFAILTIAAVSAGRSIANGFSQAVSK